MSRSSFHPEHALRSYSPRPRRRALPGQNAKLGRALQRIDRERLPVQNDHMQTPESWRDVWADEEKPCRR